MEQRDLLMEVEQLVEASGSPQRVEDIVVLLERRGISADRLTLDNVLGQYAQHTLVRDGQHRWTTLRLQVLQVVHDAGAPLRAKEIAAELSRRGLQVDRAMVNKFLYLSGQLALVKENDHRWRAVAASVPGGQETDDRPVASSGAPDVQSARRAVPAVHGMGPLRARRWQTDLREFGKAFGCEPDRADPEAPIPLEIGIIGLSAVGKSSLLNALVAPTCQLVPAGGVGPLTSTPLRLRYAPEATLRVTYGDRAWVAEALDKFDRGVSLSSHELGRLSLVCAGDQYAIRDPAWLAQAARYVLRPEVAKPPDDSPATVAALRGVHEILVGEAAEHVWHCDSPDGEFFRRIRDHAAGRYAGLCGDVEVGWPSPMLEAGLVLVDLPGIGTSHDSHARHTEAWIEQARAVLVVTDRSGIAESVVTCLRRNGFLSRVASGQADLIAVMTKLDQVTDDVRRQERSSRSWSSCFRSTVAAAEAELLGQLRKVFGVEARREAVELDPAVRGAVRVFGASSREHRRVVSRDEDDPPRVHIPETTGIPALRRALTTLARLRSTAWSSALLDRVRAAPNFAMLLPQLLAMVDLEGL